MSEIELLNCGSASRTMELLRGKRKIEILCMVRDGPVRLGQLTRLIPSASKKVLAENLHNLEVSGIILRRDRSGTVRHVEYDLPDALRLPMHSLLDQLISFGEAHQHQVATGFVDGDGYPRSQRD